MKIENTPKREIIRAYELKRSFFDQGNTRSYEFRKHKLELLNQTLVESEDQILEALKNDLGKPEMEAYGSEIFIVYREIHYMLKNLKKLMRAERRSTPLIAQPSSSEIIYEPRGVVLIISPWNYPFQLIMAPLAGAIAAGNAVILKPSEEAPHTAKLIDEILSSIFEQDYISVVQGVGKEVVPPLIEEYRLDHIFFTGSIDVGSKIAEMAARQLTSVTLELGGKSPAIVDKEVNIKVASKRICWGKFFNCGQTCLAPDYVIVHKDRKEEFLELCIQNIRKFYGTAPDQSDYYARIINRHHMDRLINLLNGQQVIKGGKYNEEKLYFEPTIIDEPDLADQLMKEEIFGPILPVISYDDESELLSIVRNSRYPLSLYVFTKRKSFKQFVLENFQFGNGCINNTLMQFSNIELPFGGIGPSGSGSYFGKASYAAFSNKKSIMKTASWIDPNIRYPPYTKTKFKWVKKILSYY